MNEIVKINPTEYGIEESKASELIGNLPQIQKERTELEEQFDEIIKLDIKAPETTIKARELRLLIQKNRTKGIGVWHKTTKDYFLKGGQFVDAIKRREVAINERMENDLEQIEKYAELIEQKRLEALQIERVEMLSKFIPDAHERDLSSMDCDVFESYYQTKQREYNDRILAERNAEIARIEKEKAEAKERERIRKENEQLKKEAEVNRKKQEAEQLERERLAKIEADQIAKVEARRKELERIEREKYEAKLKAKQLAEQKAIEEAEALKQSELNKGDAAKVEDLISDLEVLKKKYSFKSAKNKKMYSNVGNLLDKVITHIEIN